MNATLPSSTSLASHDVSAPFALNAEHQRALQRRILAARHAASVRALRTASWLADGEHLSNRRGGMDELVQVRPYELSDDARRIQWALSASHGEPLVVERAQPTAMRAWMLLDTGVSMLASTPSLEYALSVAANVARLVAATRLTSSDTAQMALINAREQLTATTSGSYERSMHELNQLLARHQRSEALGAPSDWEALMNYAKRLDSQRGLLLIATDEQRLQSTPMRQWQQLARHHELILIGVATLNPYDTDPTVRALNAADGRRIPAFLRTQQLEQRIEEHRVFQRNRCLRELKRCGAQALFTSSSDEALTQYMHLLGEQAYLRRQHNSGVLTTRGGAAQQGGRA